MDGVRSKSETDERLPFLRKPKAKNTNLEHLDVDGRIIFKYIFFKLFISNQNYIRFYKLICCDSI
jgi:hypothetical protein